MREAAAEAEISMASFDIGFQALIVLSLNGPSPQYLPQL